MILDEIAAAVKIRVKEARQNLCFEEVKERALGMKGGGFPFEEALSPKSRASGTLAFICEVKKASPSKGLIATEDAGGFPYLQIAKDYEEAGAAAISVLTERDFFRGCDKYLREIAEGVAIPVLRKDFVIDPYQIYEAKLLGARAVLLICALLSGDSLAAFLETAHALGLSALVETHTEDEVNQAVEAGARVIGVNNRDLRTFQVDLSTTGRLRPGIPPGIITVSESGVRTPEDIRTLSRYRIDAVLVGESLMRNPDKKAALDFLRSGVDSVGGL